MLLAAGGLCGLCGCGTSANGARGSQVRAGSSCDTAVAAAPVLGAVSQAAVQVPGSPFSVVATADGRWSFVTLNSAVEVLSNRSPAPVADRQVSVPGTPQGEQLTSDGRYLLVADGSGAVVIDVARAEDGAAGAVLGTLSSPAGRGAVEVAVSPDDRFAFVTLELSDSLAVFDLHKALASGFGPADFVGTVPLGTAPVGLAVSPDGRWIYATSESGRGAAAAPTAGHGHRDRPAPGRDQASRCGRRHGSRWLQPGAGGHLSGRQGRVGDRQGERRRARLLGRGAARRSPACAAGAGTGRRGARRTGAVR